MSSQRKSLSSLILIYFLFQHVILVYSRKHQLNLENDDRKLFRISSFGFLNEGSLEVKLKNLVFFSKFDPKLGMTITKTVSDSITPYVEGHQSKCLLAEDSMTNDGNIRFVFFEFDLNQNVLSVNCSMMLSFLEIKPGSESNITKVDSMPKDKHKITKRSETSENPHDTKNTDDQDLSATILTATTETDDVVKQPNQSCGSFKIPFKSETFGQKRKISGLQFTVSMVGLESEGLYSLYFHNCAADDEPVTPVNLSIAVVERNGENFLSAGEMPLPKLYFFMSFVFFITGCVWIVVLRKKREETFKIHHLMGLLVFVKSFSLLFHGINYNIIAEEGYPMEAWAVLYYVTHLLKGALLFITIVLIGTGWAFIKHILSEKDKKIFMIVIPLQVLANVAKIIMEESEEGESQHSTWREIFILVDLVCCGAILFPVVWSIRHLQEASQTDGKAAINLEKLKLFRRFYIMIVCYIYFTRIIVYLLKITVPFQYAWLDEVFRETATVAFFIVTGINFQPTAKNPYFRLSQDDLEMEEVITQSGFTENVAKTVRSRDINTNSGWEDEEIIATKRESSHEYD